MLYLHSYLRKWNRALSSVGSEHLPYKQGVAGSNPAGPTEIAFDSSKAILFSCLWLIYTPKPCLFSITFKKPSNVNLTFINCKFIAIGVIFVKKNTVKINWKSTEDINQQNSLHLLNLEYAVELQVILILIKEAEHLMEYRSLITVEVDPNDGGVSINDETPEPLFSILHRNFHGFDSKLERSLSLHQKAIQPSFVSI